MTDWFVYLKRGLSRRMPQDRVSSFGAATKPMSLYGALRPYLGKHWRKGLTATAIFVATTLLSYPQPLISRHLIDTVVLGQQLGQLPWVLLLLGAITLSVRILDTVQPFFFKLLQQDIILEIQGDLLDRALRLPKSFFDSLETGYLMSRLSRDIGGLGTLLSEVIIRVLTNILRFIGGLVFLYYLEWRLALGVTVLVPLVLLFSHRVSGRLRAVWHHTMEQDANVSSRLHEALSSIPLIKSFSSEARTVRRLVAELKESFQLGLEQVTLSSVASLGIRMIPSAVRFAVLAIGALWVIKGQWTLGSLYAFQSYLEFVFGPATVLAATMLSLQNSLASLERVMAIFGILPEENLETGLQVRRLRGEVELRNVSFAYDLKKPVLEEVSLHVRPGEHVSIVGPSGVGKTTLLSLILRFYTPTKGEILFDGLPASEYEVGSLRRRIGYVSQRTLLLAETIATNLRYGNPGASHQDIVRAATVSGIHDFILGLPEGYETKLGEGGVLLSEGQEQRLALARALVKDPDILILDEPTAALDSHTEKSIFESLPDAIHGKTLFIVAHRLSTFAASDRILLLRDSHLVDSGSHESLMESNEYYRELVTYQQHPTIPRPSPETALPTQEGLRA